MRIAQTVMVAATLVTPVLAATPDWSQVDQALGRSGASMPGDVHRYGFPRSDLHVTVDGVTLLPAFALGGWLAFKPDGAVIPEEFKPAKVEPVVAEVVHGHLHGTSSAREVIAKYSI